MKQNEQKKQLGNQRKREINMNTSTENNLGKSYQQNQRLQKRGNDNATWWTQSQTQVSRGKLQSLYKR